MNLCRQGEDAAPTRVMVFAPTSEAAQACASPIRNVLWGAHKVAVLLPQGEEPIKVSELPFSLSLCAFQACPLYLFSLILCAFQPAILFLSAFPFVPFSLLVPFCAPLCTFQPAPCTSQHSPLHLSACSLCLLAFPFEGFTEAQTGDEQNTHS